MEGVGKKKLANQMMNEKSFYADRTMLRIYETTKTNDYSR